jgi:hypothetical protein
VHHVVTDAGWPPLPYGEWNQTRGTLHMYTQVAGKLRLALSPFEPQWGHVALYVTARGLTTSPIPFGLRAFDLEFDLVDNVLVARSSDGDVDRRPLGGTVADFYTDVMAMLARMRIEVGISVLPSEVPDPIPFPDDRTHHVYDAAQATRFFRVLSLVDSVLKEHRAGFRGRTTPVHFFWGSFDLVLTRFSGRMVTPPADAGVIGRYGGDAEQIAAGWWPGDHRVSEPAFFAYGSPKPDGIERVRIQPDGGGWRDDLGEFVLPYEAARASADPRGAALAFFRSTYDAAAGLMGWDPDLTQVTPPPRR